jgi:hypothetical protein
MRTPKPTIASSINDELEHAETFDRDTTTEIQSVDKKIKVFGSMGWSFIVTGFIAFLAPLILRPIFNGYGDLNLLGDYAGGVVASLWSLAGFMYIYVAFLGQKQTGLRQQIEIVYAQTNSNITRLELKEQRFEDTFFQLLSTHNEILSLMDYKNRDGVDISRGRDVFRSYHTDFTQRLNVLREIGYRKKEKLPFNEDLSNYAPGLVDGIRLTPDQVIDTYSKMYVDREGDLGHYFRNLTNILTYIDETDVIDNKRKYYKLIFGLLSIYEMVHLYYFTASLFSSVELRQVIVTHKLFDYVSTHLVEYEEDYEFYFTENHLNGK